MHDNVLEEIDSDNDSVYKAEEEDHDYESESYSDCEDEFVENDQAVAMVAKKDEVGHMWDMDSDITEVYLGLYSKFKNPRVFRYVFKAYATRKGFDYHYLFVRNNAMKIGIMCTQPGCKFWCWCSRQVEGIEIRNFQVEHNCVRPMQNSRVIADFITQRFLHTIRTTPEINVKSLQAIVQEKLKVLVRWSELYRALSKAKELISGDLMKQFKDLYTYCEMIRRSNPGSRSSDN